MLNLSFLHALPTTASQTLLVAQNDGADAIDGVFSSILGLPSGYSATVDYAFAETDLLGRVGDGNDLAVTVSSVPETAGDYNGDGVVDGFDFLAWQRGESPNPFSTQDLEDWKSHYGTTAGSRNATGSVPEPHALTLLVLGAAGALFGRGVLFRE